MSTNRRLIKNFFSLSFAEFIARVFGTALNIYIARLLGANVFGQFGFATAFISYFSIGADFGLTTLGIREVAKDKSKTTLYGTNILVLQVGLSIALTLLLGLVLIFMPIELRLKWITFLFGLGIIPLALNMGYIFQAHEKMEYVAISRVIGQISYVVLGFYLVYLFRDILVLPIVQLATAFLTAGVVIFLLKNKFNFTWSQPNLKEMRLLAKKALPFLISAFAIQIYYNLSFVILQIKKGSEAVGYYSAGFKIVLLLLLVPYFIQTTFFPLFSSLSSDSEESKKQKKLISKLLLFIFLPLTLGGIAFSRELIIFIYGQAYLKAVVSFNILLLLPLLVSLSAIVATPLLAHGGERIYSRALVLSALASILLSLLLIPKFSTQGAALATVAAEMIGLFYLLLSNREFFTLIATSGAKSLACALIMLLVVLILKNRAEPSILVTIPLAGFIYLILNVLSKNISYSDFSFILRLPKGKTK
jgi:O-antigen/teichoic acid export membrane protein